MSVIMFLLISNSGNGPWHPSGHDRKYHYSDVIMGAMASQITSLPIVYSTVYPGAGQRKHQSTASLAFVRIIQRWPVNSPHQWPENVSIWWRHHVQYCPVITPTTREWSEICAFRFEFKIWSMFYVNHCSTVWNILWRCDMDTFSPLLALFAGRINGHRTVSAVDVHRPSNCMWVAVIWNLPYCLCHNNLPVMDCILMHFTGNTLESL